MNLDLKALAELVGSTTTVIGLAVVIVVVAGTLLVTLGKDLTRRVRVVLVFLILAGTFGAVAAAIKGGAGSPPALPTTKDADAAKPVVVPPAALPPASPPQVNVEASGNGIAAGRDVNIDNRRNESSEELLVAVKEGFAKLDRRLANASPNTTAGGPHVKERAEEAGPSKSANPRAVADDGEAIAEDDAPQDAAGDMVQVPALSCDVSHCGVSHNHGDPAWTGDNLQSCPWQQQIDWCFGDVGYNEGAACAAAVAGVLVPAIGAGALGNIWKRRDMMQVAVNLAKNGGGGAAATVAICCQWHNCHACRCLEYHRGEIAAYLRAK